MEKRFRNLKTGEITTIIRLSEIRNWVEQPHFTGENDKECDEKCPHNNVRNEGGWSSSFGELEPFNFCEWCGLPEDRQECE